MSKNSDSDLGDGNGGGGGEISMVAGRVSILVIEAPRVWKQQGINTGVFQKSLDVRCSSV